MGLTMIPALLTISMLSGCGYYNLRVGDSEAKIMTTREVEHFKMDKSENNLHIEFGKASGFEGISDDVLDLIRETAIGTAGESVQ